MENKLLMFILISAVVLYGCANPFRKKTQCETLCEQMHSECTLNCPVEGYDAECNSRCDRFNNCIDTCDKPLFNEEDSGSENK